MNEELNAMAEAISILRKIYAAAQIDEFGNAVIEKKQYPNFFSETLRTAGYLERVLSSNLLVNMKS